MHRITLQAGKRGGKPCIRDLRITVYDVLALLAEGVSPQEILEDFPELELADILAVLSFAADRERRVHVIERFVECMSGIVPTKTKEWLTTEDAARLSGFSRPFIIALLDGPLYTGQVTRTDKGHRRVNRSEFEDWLKKASISKSQPKTVAQVRSEILFV